MIKDKTEYENFISKLPKLRDDEVIFVSLSARNKYLTAVERDKFGLSRTEMFGREIIYENTMEAHELIMTKLSTVREWRKTKLGMVIPEKALVVYMNLNPSHTVRAMGNFMSEMMKEMFMYNENLASGHDLKNNLKRFKNCRGVLNTQLQKSSSRKLFIDIDIDCIEQDILNEAMSILTKNECKYFVVKTQGGYHICVKRDSLGFNYVHDVIDHCNTMIKNNNYEGVVENNKNFMVPVPGTLQANKSVKLVYSNYYKYDTKVIKVHEKFNITGKGTCVMALLEDHKDWKSYVNEVVELNGEAKGLYTIMDAEETKCNSFGLQPLAVGFIVEPYEGNSYGFRQSN